MSDAPVKSEADLVSRVSDPPPTPLKAGGGAGPRGDCLIYPPGEVVDASASRHAAETRRPIRRQDGKNPDAAANSPAR